MPNPTRPCHVKNVLSPTYRLTDKVKNPRGDCGPLRRRPARAQCGTRRVCSMDLRSSAPIVQEVPCLPRSLHSTSPIWGVCVWGGADAHSVVVGARGAAQFIE